MVNEEDYIAIGKRLAEIRRSHKTTQDELAEMLGVSPKHISHVENAASSFSLSNLIRFCRIFGCSMDYIILGRESNETLSKLPEGIVSLLNTGSDTDVDRLKRYLDVFVELKEEAKK